MTQDDFYEKIPDWISKDIESWNHITLMAYFCHKYEQKNNVRFRLVRWKGDPGKGKESRDFSRLFKTLAPENYEDLDMDKKSLIKSDIIFKIYNYINWMFDYKFRSGDKSVTGTRIFLMPSMINEFERMYSKITRENNTKSKFDDFIKWCGNNIPEVFESQQLDEVRDIRMLKRYVEMYSIDKERPESRAVLMAISMGLING